MGFTRNDYSMQVRTMMFNYSRVTGTQELLDYKHSKVMLQKLVHTLNYGHTRSFHFYGAEVSQSRNGRRPTSCIIWTNAFEPGWLKNLVAGSFYCNNTGETPTYLKLTYDNDCYGINGKVLWR